MKKVVLGLFITATGFIAYGQEKVLLNDHFNDNRNNWYLQKNIYFLTDVKDGVLHLEKFEKNFIQRGCLWYNKAIPGLNTLQDFSITLHARLISGGDIFEMIDMQWGQRDTTGRGREKDDLYQMSLAFRREVKLEYFNSGWNFCVRKNIRALLDSNKFNPRQFNKYELIQKAGFIIFRVNDIELLKHMAEPIPGNSIGFQQCLKSAWEIDQIVVRQLDNNPGKILVDTLVTSPENTVVNSGLKVYPNPFNDLLNLNFTLDKAQQVEVCLFDMNGNIPQRHVRQLPKGGQNFRMYADVPPGSYIIVIKTADGKRMTATVIKL